MQRRYNLAYFILASVVVLGLTPLMVGADPQAQIAFTSERDGHRQIYVMDADGGNQRRLSNNPFCEFDPSWSPDGKYIAFTSTGRQNTAGGHWRIYVMDADGGNKRRLSNGAVDDWDPSWSPDGKRIAFVSSRDGRGHDIYVMDADGKNQSTDDLSRDTDPSWTRIAFVSHKDGIYVMNEWEESAQTHCED